VIILNALSVDPGREWKGPWRWYEESMLNCCVDLEEVKKIGITLTTFVCLALCQGLDVTYHLGQESSIDDFRQAVRSSCISNSSDDDNKNNKTQRNEFLVVSYSRKTLGQTGSGHFSPVAAYDETSDSVLILDTARFKYGTHWVSLQLLFDAMLPIDPATTKSRGYILISHDGVSENKESHLPISILFRSSKSQNFVRKQYKSFLSERGGCCKPIEFQDVLRYWTKDGNDNLFVWNILSPQLCRKSEEEEQNFNNLLSLIKRLLSDVPDVPKQLMSLQNTFTKDKKCCEKSSSISVAEAIYVIYLASLRKDQRKEILFADSVSDPEFTKNQLLDEAALVHIALNVSDME